MKYCIIMILTIFVTVIASAQSPDSGFVSPTDPYAVSGPSSETSTDNAVARWDGTDGKTLQNSVVLIGDTGAVTGVTDLTASGTVAAGTLTEHGNAVPNALNHLGFFAATTSAQLAGVLSDETGTGSSVFSYSPTLGGSLLLSYSHTASTVGLSTTVTVDALDYPEMHVGLLLIDAANNFRLVTNLLGSNQVEINTPIDWTVPSAIGWTTPALLTSHGGAYGLALAYSRIYAPQDLAICGTVDATGLEVQGEAVALPSNPISWTWKPAAGASGNTSSWTPVLNAMNGSDVVNILNISLTNADHTGASNQLNGINFQNITGDADATETAINVGTGWDVGMSASGNPANAEWSAINLYHSEDPASGNSSQALSLNAYARGTINNAGSYDNYYLGYIRWNKNADYYGVADANDMDSSVVIAVNQNNTLRPWTLTWNAIYDNSLNLYLGAGASSKMYYGLYCLQNSDAATAGYTHYGGSALTVEGATADDDELTINYPAYNDTTTGVVADPTVVMGTYGGYAVDIAANGGGTAATATLDPYQWSNVVVYTCSDTDGCDLTLAESLSTIGQTITITNTTANALNLADQAGILEINAGAVALGANDTITLIYTGAIWIETSRSDN